MVPSTVREPERLPVRVTPSSFSDGNGSEAQGLQH